MLVQLINQTMRLFSWAWNWELPLDGFHIYPVQLGIAVFCVEVLIDALIPSVGAMFGKKDKGDD